MTTARKLVDRIEIELYRFDIIIICRDDIIINNTPLYSSAYHRTYRYTRGIGMMLKNTEADLRPGKQQQLMLGAFGGPQMLADALHAATAADDDDDEDDCGGVDRKDDMYAAMAMKDSPATVAAAGLQDGNGFWMAAVSAAGPQMDHHAADYQPAAVPDYMMHHVQMGGADNVSPVDPQHHQQQHHQAAAAAAAAAMYQMQQQDQQVIGGGGGGGVVAGGGGGGGQQEYPWMKEKKTTRKNNHQGNNY